MNMTLIVAGVQATLRAAQAGADMYSEHSRDRAVFLPTLELPPASRFQQLEDFFIENSDNLPDDIDIQNVWDNIDQRLTTNDKVLLDNAYVAMIKIQAKGELDALANQTGQGFDARKHVELAVGGRMVEQWRTDRKPPSLVARAALTLADIGLEFVASNPSILGAESRGENLIVSFATHLSDAIPSDIGEFGKRAQFADRVIGVFVRSGLSVLVENGDHFFDDEDIKKLAIGVINPVIAGMPDNLIDQIDYRNLIDALVGPSADAALGLLAQNTQGYLGRKFANDKALGAVTTSLFTAAKQYAGDGNVFEVFGKNGLSQLYKSVLSVAIDSPELFLVNLDRNEAKDELIKQLFVGSAKTLHDNPNFNNTTGLAFTKMVIEVVGQQAPALLSLDNSEPWEKVAIDVLESLTNSLTAALVDNAPLQLFSQEKLLELGRIILLQTASTPQMLGAKNKELNTVIAGIAAGMAADDKLLLTTDDWIVIAGIAAQQAAANPGRLFGLDENDKVEGIAIGVIQSVLTVAGTEWQLAPNAGLSHHTLVSALKITLEKMSGNIKGLKAQPEFINEYFKLIATKATEDPDAWGSESILDVIELTISNVLKTGSLPTSSELSDII